MHFKVLKCWSILCRSWLFSFQAHPVKILVVPLTLHFISYKVTATWSFRTWSDSLQWSKVQNGAARIHSLTPNLNTTEILFSFQRTLDPPSPQPTHTHHLYSHHKTGAVPWAAKITDILVVSEPFIFRTLFPFKGIPHLHQSDRRNIDIFRLKNQFMFSLL